MNASFAHSLGISILVLIVLFVGAMFCIRPTDPEDEL